MRTFKSFVEETIAGHEEMRPTVEAVILRTIEACAVQADRAAWECQTKGLFNVAEECRHIAKEIRSLKDC